MLIDFIGSLAAGLGLMGLMLMLNRLILRNRFDRWIYPATVAFGMVAYTIWAEYTWPSRTIDAQPQLRLVSENGESLFYRPWTYVWPQTTRMTAIDLAATRTNAALPDLVMTHVVLLGRWEPVRVVGVVYDCANNARADLIEGATINDDGSLQGADWRQLEADDAVLHAACAAGQEILNGRGSDS